MVYTINYNYNEILATNKHSLSVINGCVSTDPELSTLQLISSTTIEDSLGNSSTLCLNITNTSSPSIINNQLGNLTCNAFDSLQNISQENNDYIYLFNPAIRCQYYLSIIRKLLLSYDTIEDLNDKLSVQGDNTIQKVNYLSALSSVDVQEKYNTTIHCAGELETPPIINSNTFSIGPISFKSLYPDEDVDATEIVNTPAAILEQVMKFFFVSSFETRSISECNINNVFNCLQNRDIIQTNILGTISGNIITTFHIYIALSYIYSILKNIVQVQFSIEYLYSFTQSTVRIQTEDDVVGGDDKKYLKQLRYMCVSPYAMSATSSKQIRKFSGFGDIQSLNPTGQNIYLNTLIFDANAKLSNNILNNEQQFNGNFIYTYITTSTHAFDDKINISQLLTLYNIVPKMPIKLINLLNLIDYIFFTWMVNISTHIITLRICHGNCHGNFYTNTKGLCCFCGKCGTEDIIDDMND